ncbi:hypothetical protein TNCT6_70860 [Streptomyces sp. 6-11-2]|nr:hypothetical protein TNCT6_70860 [Streptomyces sp. 6-11-2]
MTGAGMARVRRARVADLPLVAQLAAEHAAHERAAPQPTDLARRLETLRFATETPRLRCFVAELNEEEITGHASCAPEVSTGDEAAAALSSTPEDALAQVHPGSIVMSARWWSRR